MNWLQIISSVVLAVQLAIHAAPAERDPAQTKAAPPVLRSSEPSDSVVLKLPGAPIPPKPAAVRAFAEGRPLAEVVRQPRQYAAQLTALGTDRDQAAVQLRERPGEPRQCAGKRFTCGDLLADCAEYAHGAGVIRLLGNGAQILFFLSGSGSTLQGRVVCSEQKILCLAPTNVSSRIVQPPNNDYVFTVATSAERPQAVRRARNGTQTGRPTPGSSTTARR